MKATAICAGEEHALALLEDGSVVSWGRGPKIPDGFGPATAVAAGNFITLALLDDGTVAGLGHTEVPSGLSSVTAIAAGSNSSYAIREGGQVVGWGTSTFDNIGPMETLRSPFGRAAAISVGGWQYNLALLADGSVENWASSWGAVQPPTGLSRVAAVAVGFAHGLALLDDGTAVTWGDEQQLVSANLAVPTGLSDVTAIAAGGAHSLALRADGTVVGWGVNHYGQAEVPPGLSEVVAISAGTEFSLALTASGRVVAWGRNQYGQTSVPAEIAVGTTFGDDDPTRSGNPRPIVLSIGGGRTHYLITSGSPDEKTEVTASKLPDEKSLLAMVERMRPLTTSDGMSFEARTALARSLNSLAARSIVEGNTPQALGPLREAEGEFARAPHARQIWPELQVVIGLATVRYNQAVALTLMGRAHEADEARRRASRAVDEMDRMSGARYGDLLRAALDALAHYHTRNVLAIGSGGHSGYFSAASIRPAAIAPQSREPGSVWAWGDNYHGQLGDGSRDSRMVPSPVVGLTDVTQIDFTGDWSLDSRVLALRSDGTVCAWGGRITNRAFNGSRVPEPVPGVTDIVSIREGFAVKSDGTLWDLRVTFMSSGTEIVPDFADAKAVHPIAPLLYATAIDGTTAVVELDTYSWAQKGSYHWGRKKRSLDGPRDVTEVVTWTDCDLNVGIEGFYRYDVALTRDGAVWQWRVENPGTNKRTEMAYPFRMKDDPNTIPGLAEVISIRAGDDYCVAVKADGTVWAWGENNDSQLGNGTRVNSPMPSRVVGLADIVAVEPFGTSCFALAADGTVWAWGRNGDGQLGDGTNEQRNQPVHLSGLTGVSALHAGFAITGDGRIWSWGTGSAGRLADGTETSRNTPQLVKGITKIATMASRGSTWFAVAFRE